MVKFEYFIVLLFLARSCGAILEMVSAWQVKEYRWDRMREHLFRQGGEALLFPTRNIVLFLLLALNLLFSIFGAPQRWEAEWFPMGITIFFLAECLQYAHLALTHHLKRPKPTLKALVIFATSFAPFVMISVLQIFWNWWEIGALAFLLGTVVLFEFDIVSLSVLIFNPLFALLKRRIFLQAQAKRLARKDLVVVGITGSFGKSSVKEFLSHILSAKFSVLKTEKNTNTEIGIANTLLNKLQPHHNIFVCEMGAYGPGEIRLCCRIARPSIGIFTGLNEQHQALFGSLDKTFQAKWELLTSLPAKGLAVFNGDSDELQKRLLPLSLHTALCTSGMTEKVEVSHDRLSFVYQGVNFEAPVVGRFQLINLLMAITVAEHLGMGPEEISAQVRTIQPTAKNLQLIPFSKGFILDASYNVNPDGLREACRHLSTFEDHVKVLFFPGILELGPEAESIHENLGRFIGNHVDHAFFFDAHFSESLSRGALQTGLTKKHIVRETDQEEMKKRLQEIFDENLRKKFVILFESRGAERVMDLLK